MDIPGIRFWGLVEGAIDNDSSAYASSMARTVPGGIGGDRPMDRQSEPN